MRKESCYVRVTLAGSDYHRVHVGQKLWENMAGACLRNMYRKKIEVWQNVKKVDENTTEFHGKNNKVLHKRSCYICAILAVIDYDSIQVAQELLLNKTGIYLRNIY